MHLLAVTVRVEVKEHFGSKLARLLTEGWVATSFHLAQVVEERVAKRVNFFLHLLCLVCVALQATLLLYCFDICL